MYAKSMKINNYTYRDVHATIILDNRREKKNGLYPVKSRITHKRKQKYYPTGVDLSEDSWEILFNSKKKELKQDREDTLQSFEKVTSSIKQVYTNEEYFSFELLDKYYGIERDSKLKDLFTNKIKELEKEGRVGTAELYQCTIKSLLEYTSKATLEVSDITLDFLKSYERWMIESGNSYTTVGIYLRHLRAIINIAISNKMLNRSKYPFGKDKYQIPTSEPRNIAFNKDQINEIRNFPLKLGSSADLARDIWMFSFYSNGMNMYDICLLKYADLVNGEIHFIRKKTINTSKKKIEITVTMLPEHGPILKKWSKPGNISDYVFPFLEKNLTPEEEKKRVKDLTKLVNKYMSRIGKQLGFGKINTYSARHSFGNILNSSGVPLTFLQQSFGHKHIDTTISYVSSFDRGSREEFLKNLTNP